MSIKTVETGLPFFTDIQKQARYRSYFNTYLQEWICPKNRLPALQFYGSDGASSFTNFDLIDADTGATVSYLTHWNANHTTATVDIEKYYMYAGTYAVTLTPGRYYLYAKDDLNSEWWSEVFTVTNLEE